MSEGEIDGKGAKKTDILSACVCMGVLMQQRLNYGWVVMLRLMSHFSAHLHKIYWPQSIAN